MLKIFWNWLSIPEKRSKTPPCLTIDQVCRSVCYLPYPAHTYPFCWQRNRILQKLSSRNQVCKITHIIFNVNFTQHFFFMGNDVSKEFKTTSVSITFTCDSLISKDTRWISPPCKYCQGSSRNATIKHHPSCWLSGKKQYYYPVLIRLPLSKKWEINLGTPREWTDADMIKFFSVKQRSAELVGFCVTK